MEIIEVTPQGFCGGVMRAIQIARKTREDNPDTPITVLGMLVHNAFVNQELKDLGLRVVDSSSKSRLELLDEIDEGIVIFTAHGVSNAVRKKATDKHLQIVDASCRFVLITRDLICKRLQEGYTIFYIGKKGHAEAEGAITEDDRQFLIEHIQDIPAGIQGKIFVTNQTTMSVLELEELFAQIQARYPQAEFASEICTATRLRQQAVHDLANRNVDLLLVIGDPKSNNTRKLANTGTRAGIPNVLQIESAADLRLKDLEGIHTVAVTSGASTPEFLKDEVLCWLKENA